MAKPKPVGVPGLRARVIRGPREGRWYWRAERSDGSTAWTGWATREEAGVEVSGIVARGEHVPQPPEDAPPKDDDGGEIRTLDQLLRGYRAHLEDTRPELAASTFTAYALQTRQVRAVGADGTAIDRLDASAMEAVRAALLRRYAPRTAEQVLYLVGAAHRWGRREGICPDRELVVPRVKVPPRAKRTPTDDVIQRVIDGITVPWTRLCVRLLWHTGARIGEIAALTWDAVDLDGAMLRVAGKTGERLVPIGPELVAELRAWRAWQIGAAPTLLGVTFHTARQHTRRGLIEGCEKAGVPYFSAHAIRRAAVDVLAREGVDVSTAAAILGHSPQVMLAYYRQVTAEDRAGAARVLARRKG